MQIVKIVKKFLSSQKNTIFKKNILLTFFSLLLPYSTGSKQSLSFKNTMHVAPLRSQKKWFGTSKIIFKTKKKS